MRALVCARVHDMILRPRIPQPHLGRDWSGSHVRSNPLPIALFPSAVRARIARAYARREYCAGKNAWRHGDLYIRRIQREILSLHSLNGSFT